MSQNPERLGPWAEPTEEIRKCSCGKENTRAEYLAHLKDGTHNATLGKNKGIVQ